MPVAGIASPSLFLGFAFLFFLNLYKAWIQRRPGVDTEMARRGYSDVLFLGLHFLLKYLIQSVDTVTARHGYRDGQAWIQRWPGVDIATAQTSNEIQNIVALATQIRGRLYCDRIVSTEKKHLDVAISMIFRGYCHILSWQN